MNITDRNLLSSWFFPPAISSKSSNQLICSLLQLWKTILNLCCNRIRWMDLKATGIHAAILCNVIVSLFCILKITFVLTNWTTLSCQLQFRQGKIRTVKFLLFLFSLTVIQASWFKTFNYHKMCSYMKKCKTTIQYNTNNMRIGGYPQYLQYI